MPTKEPMARNERDDARLPETLAAVAIELLAMRIGRLSPDDCVDFAELIDEIRRQDITDEERDEAVGAMQELLTRAHRPTPQLHRVPQDSHRPAELERWASHVGNAVKALRQEQKLTQAQLAAAAGLPQSHLSRIETAKLSPSSHTIDRLAKALGVEPARIDPARD